MAKQRTNDEFLNELKRVNPCIIPIEEYKMATKKILCKCSQCNSILNMRPCDLLKGHGCATCKIKAAADRRRKTNSEFINELNEANPTIKPLEDYLGCHKKIKFKCLECGNIWITEPSKIIHAGHGCPVCGFEKQVGSITRTNQQFLDELKKINPNIKPLENYIKNNIKIKFECLIDGYQWVATPAKVLSGSTCPKCRGAMNGDNNLFVEKLKTIHPNIQPLEKYKGAYKKIRYRCTICGKESTAVPHNLLSGYGCPKCKTSKGESEIKHFLDDNHIVFEFQKTFDGLNGCGNKKMSYDFYLPKYNMLIEYQGEQHYKPIKYFGGEEKFKIQQEHDELKRKYAKENGYNLLEISYLDFDNIYKILELNLCKERLAV